MMLYVPLVVGEPERLFLYVRRDRDPVEAGGAQPLYLPRREGDVEEEAHTLPYHRYREGTVHTQYTMHSTLTFLTKYSSQSTYPLLY